MQKIRRRRIGEILVAEGLVNQEQLASALERQQQSGETVGEILLDMSIVSENDIVRAICIQYQLPFIRPSSYRFTMALAEAFDPLFLYRYRVLPLDRIGSAATVAIGEIPPESVENDLREKLGEELYFFFAPTSEVETILREHFSLSQEDILSLNSERSHRIKKGKEPAATLPVHDNLLETLDSSWESVFDQAEQNLHGPQS